MPFIPFDVAEFGRWLEGEADAIAKEDDDKVFSNLMANVNDEDFIAQ